MMAGTLCVGIYVNVMHLLPDHFMPPGHSQRPAEFKTMLL
jgi:hypothetical protein